MAADARLLADVGDYRGALKRCLTLRKLAVHMGHDPNLGYYANLCDERALSYVIDVLGRMPVEAKNLLWLREQLTVKPPVALQRELGQMH